MGDAHQGTEHQGRVINAQSGQRHMDGIKKLLSALVVLAAGIFWATHGHAAAPIHDADHAPAHHRSVPGNDA